MQCPEITLAAKYYKFNFCLFAQLPSGRYMLCQLQMESIKKEDDCKVAALEENLADVTRKLAELEAQHASKETAAMTALQNRLADASSKLAEAEAAVLLSQQTVADISGELSSMRLEQAALRNEADGLRASLSAANSAVQQQSAHADTWESKFIGEHLRPHSDQWATSTQNVLSAAEMEGGRCQTEAAGVADLAYIQCRRAKQSRCCRGEAEGC